jgi:hypothetical protein
MNDLFLVNTEEKTKDGNVIFSCYEQRFEEVKRAFEYETKLARVHKIDEFTDGYGEKCVDFWLERMETEQSTPEQSIPDGSKVKFHLRGFDIEDFEDVDIEISLSEYEGKIGTVECLDTYTELGDRDFEYYSVAFPSLPTLHAISGYHLEVVEF